MRVRVDDDWRDIEVEVDTSRHPEQVLHYLWKVTQIEPEVTGLVCQGQLLTAHNVCQLLSPGCVITTRLLENIPRPFHPSTLTSSTYTSSDAGPNTLPPTVGHNGGQPPSQGVARSTSQDRARLSLPLAGLATSNVAGGPTTPALPRNSSNNAAGGDRIGGSGGGAGAAGEASMLPPPMTARGVAGDQRLHPSYGTQRASTGSIGTHSLSSSQRTGGGQGGYDGNGVMPLLQAQIGSESSKLAGSESFLSPLSPPTPGRSRAVYTSPRTNKARGKGLVTSGGLSESPRNSTASHSQGNPSSQGNGLPSPPRRRGSTGGVGHGHGGGVTSPPSQGGHPQGAQPPRGWGSAMGTDFESAIVSVDPSSLLGGRGDASQASLSRGGGDSGFDPQGGLRVPGTPAGEWGWARSMPMPAEAHRPDHDAGGGGEGVARGEGGYRGRGHYSHRNNGHHHHGGGEVVYRGAPGEPIAGIWSFDMDPAIQEEVVWEELGPWLESHARQVAAFHSPWVHAAVAFEQAIHATKAMRRPNTVLVSVTANILDALFLLRGAGSGPYGADPLLVQQLRDGFDRELIRRLVSELMLAVFATPYGPPSSSSLLALGGGASSSSSSSAVGGPGDQKLLASGKHDGGSTTMLAVGHSALKAGSNSAPVDSGGVSNSTGYTRRVPFFSQLIEARRAYDHLVKRKDDVDRQLALTQHTSRARLSWLHKLQAKIMDIMLASAFTLWRVETAKAKLRRGRTVGLVVRRQHAANLRAFMGWKKATWISVLVKVKDQLEDLKATNSALLTRLASSNAKYEEQMLAHAALQEQLDAEIERREAAQARTDQVSISLQEILARAAAADDGHHLEEITPLYIGACIGLSNGEIEAARARVLAIQCQDPTKLLLPGQSLTSLLGAPKHEVLLQWVNYQLARNDHAPVSNLSSDLSDAKALLVLNHAASPLVCSLKMLSEKSARLRAAKVLADAVGVLGLPDGIVDVGDIMTGAPAPLLCYCAHLMEYHPRMEGKLPIGATLELLDEIARANARFADASTKRLVKDVGASLGSMLARVTKAHEAVAALEERLSVNDATFLKLRVAVGRHARSVLATTRSHAAAAPGGIITGISSPATMTSISAESSASVVANAAAAATAAISTPFRAPVDDPGSQFVASMHPSREQVIYMRYATTPMVERADFGDIEGEDAGGNNNSNPAADSPLSPTGRRKSVAASSFAAAAAATAAANAGQPPAKPKDRRRRTLGVLGMGYRDFWDFVRDFGLVMGLPSSHELAISAQEVDSVFRKTHVGMWDGYDRWGLNKGMGGLSHTGSGPPPPPVITRARYRAALKGDPSVLTLGWVGAPVVLDHAEFGEAVAMLAFAMFFPSPSASGFKLADAEPVPGESPITVPVEAPHGMQAAIDQFFANCVRGRSEALWRSEARMDSAGLAGDRGGGTRGRHWHRVTFAGTRRSGIVSRTSGADEGGDLGDAGSPPGTPGRKKPSGKRLPYSVMSWERCKSLLTSAGVIDARLLLADAEKMFFACREPAFHVPITASGAAAGPAEAQPKPFVELSYLEFQDYVATLALYKQPNPFLSFHQRLLSFGTDFCKALSST
eukprot:jgi/Mesvir1/9864/Mv22402-RA.1